ESRGGVHGTHQGRCGVQRPGCRGRSAVTTRTPYRSPVHDGRDGFPQLLHAEWAKFRTVRGWVLGMIVAILVTAGLGMLLVAASANVSCGNSSSGGGTQV